MAELAGFGFTFFDLLVALDAGRMGGPIRPWNCLLMDNVTMTINTSELQLLDMHPMGNFNVVGDLFLFILNISMTVKAILVDESFLCRKFMGE